MEGRVCERQATRGRRGAGIFGLKRSGGTGNGEEYFLFKLSLVIGCVSIFLPPYFIYKAFRV